MDRAKLDLLTRKLARLGFSEWSLFSEHELLHGSCFAFAVLWRFVLEAHPHFIARFMEKEEWFCLESDDHRLMVTVLRFLNASFSYRCALSPAQLLQERFFAQKAQMLIDGITLLSREEGRCNPNRHNRACGLSRPTSSHSSRIGLSAVSSAARRLDELEERRKELNHARREPLP